jgi:hypothetical protein
MTGLAQSGTAGQIAIAPAFRSFCLDYNLICRSPISVQQFVFQSLYGAVSDNPNASINLIHLHSAETFPALLRMLCDPRVPEQGTGTFSRIFRTKKDESTMCCIFLTDSLAAHYRGCQVFDTGPFQRCFAATKFDIISQFDCC